MPYSEYQRKRDLRRLIFILIIIAALIGTIFYVHSIGKTLANTRMRVSIGEDGSHTITVTAVGDIMMGSTFPESLPLPVEDGALLFSAVRTDLSSADITFGNLEGPLIDGGKSVKCADSSRNCYAFRTPVRYGRYLKDAGFDILSIANNHALDFGEDGRKSTMRVLDSLGILFAGPRGSIARIERKGVRIACIAFAFDDDSNNLNDVEAARELLRRAKKDSDLQFVSFHGGGEGARFQHVPDAMEVFLGEKRGHLRKFTHAMVDAGADLVIGHGPHVLRGMEVYKQRLIAYSLGNFATYARFNLSGPSGISCILHATLASDGVFTGGHISPVIQRDPGGPLIDSAKQSYALLRVLSASDFSTHAVSIDDEGRLEPPSP